MAAGEGTRLRPLTERWPKPILPVDGRPVVVSLIHELAAAGVDAFAVVVGHLGEQVEALVAPLPYEIRFPLQPQRYQSTSAATRAQMSPSSLVCNSVTARRSRRSLPSSSI